MCVCHYHHDCRYRYRYCCCCSKCLRPRRVKPRFPPPRGTVPVRRARARLKVVPSGRPPATTTTSSAYIKRSRALSRRFISTAKPTARTTARSRQPHAHAHRYLLRGHRPSDLREYKQRSRVKNGRSFFFLDDSSYPSRPFAGNERSEIEFPNDSVDRRHVRV